MPAAQPSILQKKKGRSNNAFPMSFSTTPSSDIASQIQTCAVDYVITKRDKIITSLLKQDALDNHHILDPHMPPPNPTA